MTDTTDLDGETSPERENRTGLLGYVINFFVGLYIYAIGGLLVLLVGLLVTLTIIGAPFGIPLMSRGYSLMMEGWDRMVPNSLQFDIGPSEEEKALQKGQAKFGDCPFCGGDVEFHDPAAWEQAGGENHTATCRNCEGEWVRTGNFTAKYTCVAGPDEYVEETKHRNEWSALRP